MSLDRVFLEAAAALRSSYGAAAITIRFATFKKHGGATDPDPTVPDRVS